MRSRQLDVLDPQAYMEDMLAWLPARQPNEICERGVT